MLPVVDENDSEVDAMVVTFSVAKLPVIDTCSSVVKFSLCVVAAACSVERLAVGVVAETKRLIPYQTKTF